jgi:hypothetical protein
MDRRQANSYGLRPESKANANTNAKLHCDPLLPKAWERCLLAIHCAAMATTAYAEGQAVRSHQVLLPLRDRS